MESCLLFKPKTAGLESVQRMEKKIDSLSSDEVISNMSKTAIESAVEGLNSDHSEDELQQLSEELAEKIGKELDGIFRRLDTRTPGVKFAKGITDSLINKQLENDLLALLNTSIDRADGNLAEAIKHIEQNLSASISAVTNTLSDNASVIEQALLETLSTRLKDSLSYFLTDALNNVEFKSFSTHLSTELLSRQFRDTLGEVVLEIKEKLSFENQVESWYKVLKDNFIGAALFLAVLFLVVSYMRDSIKYMDKEESLAKMISNNPNFKAELEQLIKDAIDNKDNKT